MTGPKLMNKKLQKGHHMTLWDRREFLCFLGRNTVAVLGVSALSSCAGKAISSKGSEVFPGVWVPQLDAQGGDNLVLVDGLESKVLVSWMDPLNAKERFGYNNDYTAYIPFSPSNPDEGFLWVNHESVHPGFVSQHWNDSLKTRAQVDIEREAVGGSILHVKRVGSHFQLVQGSAFHRRISGTASIPFAGSQSIAGARSAVGTLANCAGGVTPWGTVLTCEENFQDFYGNNVYDSTGRKSFEPPKPDSGWHHIYSLPPEHYGWVVEIDLKQAKAKKLTALGRFAHEGATVTTADDGRSVVYMGDDAKDQCFYKFISHKKGSLESGDLYVADLKQGRWIHLHRDSHPVLAKMFKTQTDLLIRTRDAARAVGGTPLDRPEDVEIDPVNKAVYVSLTNNAPRGNYFGSIWKFVEKDNNPLALEFKASSFLTGGPEMGFACPDNLVFDPAGNLWMCCDMPTDPKASGPYEKFGNNALFYIPFSGPQAGRAIRVAVGPKDCELTGPSFSPDGKTLFLSVQHPGEKTVDPKHLTSHWPDRGDSIPKPSVVCISGPLLEKLLHGPFNC